MRYGIMGGTFNPIHIGHIKAAEAALENNVFDGIWFMPSGEPAHKETGLIDKMHRFNMVEQAIGKYPHFEVSDIEIKREGNTYSVDTFEALKTLYPKDSFYLIIGSDSLLNLEQWYNSHKLLTIGAFAVVDRGGYKASDIDHRIAYYQDKYGTDIIKLTMNQIELSSSQIRDRIRMGKSISELVPEPVLHYISENHLYQ